MKKFMIICLVFFTYKADATDTLTFQLQNKATGALLRPINASKADGAKFVLYSRQNWRCMTWDAISCSGGYIFFRNYFSNKSVSVIQAGIEQQVVNIEDRGFLWKLVPMENDFYKIVSATDDQSVLTAADSEDEQVQLEKWGNKDTQLWKLLPKPTTFSG